MFAEIEKAYYTWGTDLWHKKGWRMQEYDGRAEEDCGDQ